MATQLDKSLDDLINEKRPSRPRSTAHVPRKDDRAREERRNGDHKPRGRRSLDEAPAPRGAANYWQVCSFCLRSSWLRPELRTVHNSRAQQLQRHVQPRSMTTAPRSPTDGSKVSCCDKRHSCVQLPAVALEPPYRVMCDFPHSI